jgi:ABC-type nitrate/sulfonate/bicarbonate transport system substrate-binding protein
VRSSRNLSRRELLRWSCLASAGLALAACGGTAASSSLPAGASTSKPQPAGNPSAPAAKSAASLGAPPASKGGRTLTIASTTIAGSQWPLWLAEALHAYSDRGLTVNRRMIAGDIATKALIANEVDVLMQAAAPIITANINGGTDLVFVASLFNHSQFAMGAPVAIKSGDDLKGKVVGSDRPGTTTEFQTRLLLAQVGLKASDVQVRAIGGSEVQFPALLSGQIQAATLSQPQSFQVEDKGYHILADTYKIPYQSVGAVIPRARLEELMPALTAFLQGCRQGIQAFSGQPDLALKLLQDNTKESDPAILKKTYDFYVKQAPFQEDLRPTLEGIKSVLEFLADTSVPAAKNAKAEQFVDSRVLDQLPKS